MTDTALIVASPPSTICDIVQTRQTSSISGMMHDESQGDPCRIECKCGPIFFTSICKSYLGTTSFGRCHRKGEDVIGQQPATTLVNENLVSPVSRNYHVILTIGQLSTTGKRLFTQGISPGIRVGGEGTRALHRAVNSPTIVHQAKNHGL